MEPSTTAALPVRSPALRWHCISGCGACCRLDPEQRPEALEALSPSQRQAYLGLVGADGWCIHYDSGGRRCRIYADRPDFCQVSNLIQLFGAQAADDSSGGTTDGNALAIACCLQQIRSEYGGRSRVMKRFQSAHRARRVSAEPASAEPANAEPVHTLLRLPRRQP
jgi:hypothetical protein